MTSDDGDRAARIIMAALGIETDAVANYCLPQYWPTDPEQRASIIGNRIQAEAGAVPCQSDSAQKGWPQPSSWLGPCGGTDA